MKVAVIGPVCRDENVFGERVYQEPGGVTSWSGNALGSFGRTLGYRTTIYGSHGREDDFTDSFKECDFVYVPADDTIKFVNKHPDPKNPDERIQIIEAPDNIILPEHIPDIGELSYDYIVLGPLFHNNTPKELFKELYGKGKIVLVAQGMIRYLEEGKEGKVVWKHPENVLDVLEYVDILSLDDEELKFLVHKYSISDKARYLQDRGPSRILLTEGSDGLRIFLDREYRTNAFPPKIEDIYTVGAGDTCLAADIIGQGEFPDDPEMQAKFAAMASTIFIEKPGPFDGTKEDVLERLREEYIEI